MGKGVMIYLSDEAVIALERMKKSNPGFVLSSYLSAYLSKDMDNDSNEINRLQREKLNLGEEINKLTSSITQIDLRISNIKEQQLKRDIEEQQDKQFKDFAEAQQQWFNDNMDWIKDNLKGQNKVQYFKDNVFGKEWKP
jgi:hypothetical protein